MDGRREVHARQQHNFDCDFCVQRLKGERGRGYGKKEDVVYQWVVRAFSFDFMSPCGLEGYAWIHCSSWKRQKKRDSTRMPTKLVFFVEEREPMVNVMIEARTYRSFFFFYDRDSTLKGGILGARGEIYLAFVCEQIQILGHATGTTTPGRHFLSVVYLSTIIRVEKGGFDPQVGGLDKVVDSLFLSVWVCMTKRTDSCHTNAQTVNNDMVRPLSSVFFLILFVFEVVGVSATTCVSRSSGSSSGQEWQRGSGAKK